MTVYRIAIDEDEDFKLVCDQLQDAGLTIVERFAVFGLALVEAPTAKDILAVNGILSAEPTIYTSGL